MTKQPLRVSLGYIGAGLTALALGFELALVLAVSMLIVIGDQLAQTLAGFFVLRMFIAHTTYLLVVGSAIAVLRSGRPGRTMTPGS